MSTPRPRALLVHESMFGNTARVAEAVARGLERGGYDVSLVDVALAPTGPLETDVVVVGAPTHGFSLSRPNTREDAVRRGADPAHAGTGVREWIDTLPRDAKGQLAATFDTRVRKVRRLPAAAPKIARVLRKRGFALVENPTGFFATMSPDPCSLTSSSEPPRGEVRSPLPPVSRWPAPGARLVEPCPSRIPDVLSPGRRQRSGGRSPRAQRDALARVERHGPRGCRSKRHRAGLVVGFWRHRRPCPGGQPGAWPTPRPAAKVRALRS